LKATQWKEIQAFDFDKVITKIFDKFEMLKNWKNRQIMKTLQVGKANKQRKTEQIFSVIHFFFSEKECCDIFSQKEAQFDITTIEL